VPGPTHPLTLSRAVVDCSAPSAVHRTGFVADEAVQLLIRTIFGFTNRAARMSLFADVAVRSTHTELAQVVHLLEVVFTVVTPDSGAPHPTAYTWATC
jgi:hypothetical protein